MQALKENLVKGRTTPENWVQCLEYRPQRRFLLPSWVKGRKFREVNTKLGIIAAKSYELKPRKTAKNTFPMSLQILMIHYTTWFDEHCRPSATGLKASDHLQTQL